MGRSIRLTCNDCKQSYDLNIGQGRFDNNLERVLGYFDRQSADLIRGKLSVLGEDAYWNYCAMIGYCESCGSYSSIPTITVKDLRCPKCHGKMTAEITGTWD